MRMGFYRKLRFGIGILLTVIVFAAWGAAPALADAVVSLGMAVDQPVTVIGRTPIVTLSIVNAGTSAARVTSLTCTQQGTSLVKTSSFGTPSSLPANTSMTIRVYYRANSPGTTLISCNLKGSDSATGAEINLGTSVDVNVLSETRLYFDAYSATKVATVGQAVYIIAKFGNRGSTPFTNVSLSCPELGRALVNITSPQPPSTIQPGQSGFVEQRWDAVRTGFAPIQCSLTATDSSGTQIILPATPINIEVR
jgi:hypothetical protein